MLTQQDIVDRLNQLTLRYNLTWRDIKYDADKAINKINNFMGTIYPKLTDLLTYPEATYTITTTSVVSVPVHVPCPVFGGFVPPPPAVTPVDDEITELITHEIIPEEYFHSIIIPYIAMEILARDEEFTTIYNKYTVEVQEGLFDMFQKEFNRVPFSFRQNPDQGVFFGSDTRIGQRILHNRISDIPSFKFRVYYHINNQDIVLPGIPFVQDLTAYKYGDTVTILGWENILLSSTGAFVYEFNGWSRGNNQITSSDVAEDNTLTIRSDIHLYAKWNKTSTLNINSATGAVNIEDDYIESITTLVIPDYVNGAIVRIIPGAFANHATQLSTVVLPKYLTTIESNAFRESNVSSVIFSETGKENITIQNNAFASTPYLTSIIIPTNVMTIAVGTFPVVDGKHMDIYCRRLENNIPNTWVNGWYAGDSMNYTVNVVYGYNG